MSHGEFEDVLFDQVCEVVGPGTVLLTLSSKKLNRVVGVDRRGVLVETDRSLSCGPGPTQVPAWMIAAAWDKLRTRGERSQQELLNELNVKRSRLVCPFVDAIFRGPDSADAADGG